MSSSPDTAPTMPADRTPKRIGSGRSGPIRAALRRALTEARAADRMTVEHELTGLLAERVAALVDERATAGDGAGMLRAAKDLRELMDTLPIRAITGEEVPGDSGSGRAHLVAVMDSPPSLGDSSHS